MRRGIFAPVAVAAFAVMAGGWLLQEGVDRASNIYMRVRVLQEVVDRVETSLVDYIEAEGGERGLLEGWTVSGKGRPNTTHVDKTYISPDGDIYYSKINVARHLGLAEPAKPPRASFSSSWRWTSTFPSAVTRGVWPRGSFIAICCV